MKFSTLSLILIVCAINASAKIIFKDIHAESNKEKLQSALDEVRKLFNNAIISMLVNSVDVNCMLSEYAKFNLNDKIIDKNGIDSENPEDYFLKIIFFDIAAVCSKKTDALLEFEFDNFMSYEVLYKAFINEPEVETIKDLVTCVNNFTIETGIWDNKLYPVDSNVPKDFAETCSELVQRLIQFQLMINDTILNVFKRSCALSIMSDLEALTMRTAMLLEVDLTSDQKLQEKKSHNKNTRKIMENILTCSSQPAEFKNSRDETVITNTKFLVGDFIQNFSENFSNVLGGNN
jgi:hypothetical protein